MNSQVLIDRELLQELADFCSDSRSYNEAMRVLATPAPIPDHVEDVRTMVFPDVDALKAEIAAMAAASTYDEEKERALFEADMVAEGYDVRKEPDLAGVYVGPVVHTMWQGWKRCARSRAKAAGCL